ncbi:MAG: hypothetical protein MUE55_01470 [Thermoplasmata archaeon]|nr:hypothetical protein [Thermoplasmata archaeon]
MGERKVAIIPLLVVAGALGPRQYGLLLTDQRSIFVLSSDSKAMVGGIVGGAIGAAIVEAMTEKRPVDYYNCDPVELALDKKNLCIPHSSISGIRLKKGMTGYHLKVEYADDEGKTRKLDATLAMPPELAEQRKAQGVKAKEALAEYVGSARRALEMALPAGVASTAVWDI